jgi:hypothetical protein
VVNARQIEGEFKAQAGPASTWRWFAKKIADNKFQMKFPTAQKVEELSFFTGMEMRTVPGIKFRVDKWDPYVGAKAELQTAWFRIYGLRAERRSEKRVAFVASLVGIPLEVDKHNLKRWEYVRVKIGCRDISKVPATVEGLMDLHFFDFSFQREVLVEGGSTSWNTWTRNADRSNEDNPSPKKARKGEKDNTQQGASTSKAGQINTTSSHGVNYKGQCAGPWEKLEMMEIILEGMTLRAKEIVMRGVKILDLILRICYLQEGNTCILALGGLPRFKKLQECRLVRRGQWP